ncbi:LiaF transmembrane domain-containing protein [Paenibacillus sp. S-38]|uniref:LiaF transmembrane domain-containing protein n=1 Tax=Paenibacillus sp. S-38 TaxID=3416710 RepID=UPI003CF30E37
MRMNRHTGLALLFIGFGAMILASKTGLHIGHHVMSFLFPAALVGLGFVGMKNGRTFIGAALILIGGGVLLGKMSGVFAILIAVGLIWYGFSLLRGKSAC